MKTCATLLVVVCWAGSAPAGEVAVPLAPGDKVMKSEVVRQLLDGRPPENVSGASLPESPYDLFWMSWRLWNPEPEPCWELDGRFLVVVRKTGEIDPALTKSLNDDIPWLHGGRDDDWCGGPDGNPELIATGADIVVHRFYAPGTAHMNCATTIRWAANQGKFVVKEEKALDSGLGAVTGEERIQDLARAERLWKDGERDEAMAIWQDQVQAWREGPYAAEGRPEEAFNNLGYAYWAKKDFAKAEPLLEECTDAFPERATAWLNLGDLYRDLGRRDDALRAYQKFQSMMITPAQKKVVERSIQGLKGKR